MLAHRNVCSGETPWGFTDGRAMLAETMQGRSWEGNWMPEGLIHSVDGMPVEGEHARKYLNLYARNIPSD